MKLIFIGTRANIKSHSKKHQYNAACLVCYRKTIIMIDCGMDWIDKLKKITPQPQAIFITHAHPDHAFGLKQGAPCPVYATKQTHALIKKFPIKERKIIPANRTISIGNITLKAIPVVHALTAPAIGFRITAGKRSIFYVPDLVYIPNRPAALKNIALYIGDGARVAHPRVFKRDGQLFGHTSIKTQLAWCKKEKVSQAIFTHCGTEIVSQEKKALNLVRQYSKQYNVKAKIAHDTMIVTL